jgi:hypothetical protein
MSAAGPGAKDWALLLISAGFVLLGVVILPSNRDVGILNIAFFGLCSAVGAGIVVRKLRYARLQPLRAELTGGVPIRPSRAKLAVLGAALAVVGAILIVFGCSRAPDEVVLAFWVMAGAGVLLLVGVAVGWLPAGYVQFDPEGITLGQRGWSYTVPWQRIARMAGGEYHSNPVLLLWLDDLEAVQAKPPERHAKAIERMRSSERWVGAHVLLMPEQYGLELPLLLTALERYLAEPAARAELRPRAGLAAGA